LDDENDIRRAVVRRFVRRFEKSKTHERHQLIVERFSALDVIRSTEI
jgi:hypothetical protein